MLILREEWIYNIYFLPIFYNSMKTIKGSAYTFNTLYSNSAIAQKYPYLRDINGDKDMYVVSPLHGRSFVVGRNHEDRFVVSKGNGLSYTEYSLLHTGEFYDGTWGMLLNQDAIRDFLMGLEIESLGLKVNKMEYVLEIEKCISLPNGNILHPVLLQYSVECPYRICDAAFMTKNEISKYVKTWGEMNDKGYDKAYMIAANLLIKNLRTLHDNNILHNAIHSQNYTWALELLDFELSCSPLHPYTSEDDMRHVKDLLPREIIQTYEVINYISWCLKEDMDYKTVDNLFRDYGFNLEQYKVF